MMSSLNLASAFAAVLTDRWLLDHPFYRRWGAGDVSLSELAAYAAQYRHFEGFLPAFLASLIAELPEGPSRALVEANLADEEGDPVPHLELLEGFARAVGAGFDDASPATSDLLGTYTALLAEGPLAALAGFAAYESQSSEIAASKALGLRRHYGLDDQAVSFWEHHATVDITHAAWACRAMEESTANPLGLLPFVRQAADAWWAFLDEREGAAPTPPR